jgi:hypothetical protein
MGSRLLSLSAACLIVLIVPADAAATDQVVATIPEATSVDAYGGLVVWSEPSPDGYRLMAYSAGRVSRLPIAPRLGSFDADLGPAGKGRKVAVYSRCQRLRTPSSVDGHLGCDLYRYDFASGREAPIRRANSSLDERFPTIWKKRIAFIRTYRPKGNSCCGVTRAYWRPLNGHGRTRRLDRPPAYLPVPGDLDMRGRRVALFWGGEYGGGEIRVARTSGRTSVLAKIPGSGGAAQAYNVFGVSTTGRFIYWIVTDPTETELGELRRYDLSRHREERAKLSVSPQSAGFAQDGTVGYLVVSRSSAGCRFQYVCPGPYDIHRLEGLGFERAPQLRLY